MRRVKTFPSAPYGARSSHLKPRNGPASAGLLFCAAWYRCGYWVPPILKPLRLLRLVRHIGGADLLLSQVSQVSQGQELLRNSSPASRPEDHGLTVGDSPLPPESVSAL